MTTLGSLIPSRLLLWYCVWPALIAAAPVSAQQDPAQVTTAYFEAISRGLWREAAALVHPETAQFMKAAEVCSRERAAEPPTVPRLEDYLRADSLMPREVAEYLYEREVRARQLHDSLEAKHLGVRGAVSLEELHSMPAVEFIARYLESHRPSPLDAAHMYPIKVVGHTTEGAWTNVLFRYRYELEEQDPSGAVGFFTPQPKILTLRRDMDRFWIASNLNLQFWYGEMGPGVLEAMRPPSCKS